MHVEHAAHFRTILALTHVLNLLPSFVLNGGDSNAQQRENDCTTTGEPLFA